MKKIFLILGILTLIGNSYGQKIEEIIIVPLPPPKWEDNGSELMVPQKTMPSRTITVEIIDTIPINTHIFYYSPRMEDKDYPYWQELGGNDNYWGTAFNNKAKILVPDTCEQGAKLKFHLTGYELFEVTISPYCF